MGYIRSLIDACKMISMDDSQQTQHYYAQYAQAFISDTQTVDMQSVYDQFTVYLKSGSVLLDAGCGSGRDSLYFRHQGYQVTAIDVCEDFVRHTQSYAGVKTYCMSFQQLNFEAEFDGIWASASLLHLTPTELPDAVDKLGKALKSGGVLYASFKYGEFSGLRNGRWFTDLDEKGLSQVLSNIPSLSLIKTWKSKDARPERAHERWLNCLLELRAADDVPL